MTTTSQSAGTNTFCRTNSRTSRLMRFRVTALPTFLLTVMPTRPWPSTSEKMRKCWVWNFRPRSCTRRNSRRLRSRRFLPKPNRLLLAYRHRDALAALGSPALEDQAPPAGLHPSSEPMGALSTFIVGLVGTLHDSVLQGTAGQRSIPGGMLCVKRGRILGKSDLEIKETRMARGFPESQVRKPARGGALRQLPVFFVR